MSVNASPSLQLLQSLTDIIANPQIPLAARTAFLEGLMTKGEIKNFLDRLAIRENLLLSMRNNGGKVDLAETARICKVSAALVARVMKAIRDEYPPVPVADQTLKLLLPKETRAKTIVEDILGEAGFLLEGTQINDLRQEIPSIAIRFERGGDMLTYLKAGVAQYAFVGNDKTAEILAEETLSGRKPIELDVLGQFRINSFRLCLAVPERIETAARQFTPNVLRGSVVATSYPALTRRYLDSIGAQNVTVKTLNGNVEAAPRDLGAKAITDIVQTGGSLKRNKLAEVATLLTCAMEIFSLRGADVGMAARQQMGFFVQRLQRQTSVLAAA